MEREPCGLGEGVEPLRKSSVSISPSLGLVKLTFQMR